MRPSDNILHALSQVFITAKASQFETRYAKLVEQYRMNCEIVLDLNSLYHFGRTQFKQIASLLNRNRVRRTIHAPFQEIFLGTPDALVRKAATSRLKMAFDIAKRFEPELVVIHLNYEERRFSFVYSEWLHHINENIEIFATYAQKIGALLVLENVYEETPTAMRDVLMRFSGKNVGACLDVGHVMAFSNTSLRQWLGTIGNCVRHFHLHDNDGTKDFHWPIGKGKIDFKLVQRYISQTHHPIWVTLEPHRIGDIWETLEGFCAKGLSEAMEKRLQDTSNNCGHVGQI
ncbi:MAG: sugar phosphate isomerase/epimerase [Spirochaetes bacterium]|nr:sugar phosphate isomerase/epimerase [Spirochaetota bacterium]